MAFKYYYDFTVLASQVTEDQTDFPVVFDSTIDSDLQAKLKTVSNGGHVENTASGGASGSLTVPADLIFCTDKDDPAGTKLDFEIEYYDPATGEFVAHVRIPALSSTTDTIIYICYGDSSITTSQENVESVWDSDFEAVYHFSESSDSTVYDSTANNHDSTTNFFNATSGKIGGGADLVAADSDWIDFGTVTAPGTGDFTVEWWVNPDASGLQAGFGDVYFGAPPSHEWGLSLENDKHLYKAMDSDDIADLYSDSTYSTGTWYYVVGKRQSGDHYLYVDGSQQADTDTIHADGDITADGLHVGKQRAANAYFLDAQIDELRYSRTARSSGWISTTYNNQSSPSTFYSVGSEHLYNQAPAAPTSLLCEGQTNPAGITDLTPEFSAIYNDPDAGDTATHAQIQVDDNSDFSSPIWDSGWIDIPDVTEGSRCADISYAGPALSRGVVYYWRIRFKDDDGAEGAWSTETAYFKIVELTEQTQEVFGRGHVATAGLQELFGTGHIETNATQELFGRGLAETQAAQELFGRGLVETEDKQEVFGSGSFRIQSSQEVFGRGFGTTAAWQELFGIGHILSADWQELFGYAHEITVATQELFGRGLGSTFDEQEVFGIGHLPAAYEQEIFGAGHAVTEKSQELFGFGVSPTEAEQEVFGIGGYPPERRTVVLVYDSDFKLQAQIRQWKILRYCQRISKPGTFELTLHRSAVGAQYLVEGSWVEVVRNGETVWVGRLVGGKKLKGETGEESEFKTVQAYCANDLVYSRVIVPPEGQSHLVAEGKVDDVLKFFVRKSLVSGYAEASRVLPGFTVETDTSQHPSTKKLAGRYQDNLGRFLENCAKAYGLDWWVEADLGSGTFVFRTGYPQKGEDKTDKVVFSVSRRNVLDLQYWEDGLDKASLVYVGGPGSGAAQVVQEFYEGAEPTGFDRREAFVAATDAQYASQLEVYGKAYLETFGQTVTGVRFAFQENESCRWGVDFELGDLVTVYDPDWDISVEAKINEIQVRIEEDGIEKISLLVGQSHPTEWEQLQARIGPYESFNDQEAPATPTGLSYSVGTYQDDQGVSYAKLELDWDDNSELDLSCYVAEIRRSGEEKWQAQRVTESEAIFEGLQLGGSYYARVKAVDSASNESNYANFNGGSSITMPGDTFAPDNPTNLTTYSRFKAIHLEWTNPTQKDLRHIEVWRNSSASWTGATKIAEVDGNSYTDEVGLWDATFYYALKAVDTSGNTSSGTSWVEGSTDTTPPAAPTGLSTSSGTIVDADGHIIPYIDCSWTDSTTEDVKSHEVEVQYSTDGGATWWDPIVYQCQGSPLRISPAPGNVTYRVRVRAIDDANLRSPWTSYSQGTTAKDNTVPSAPTGLSVTAGKKSIRITVDKPPDADWAGTEFHISTTSGFIPDSTTLKASGRFTSYTYDCATYDTHYVRVRHYDSSGNYSAYSSEASATPEKISPDPDIPPNSIPDGRIISISAGKITGQIVDAQIAYVDWAKIQNVVVENADIVSLSASKITTGTIAATEDVTVNGDLDIYGDMHVRTSQAFFHYGLDCDGTAVFHYIGFDAGGGFDSSVDFRGNNVDNVHYCYIDNLTLWNGVWIDGSYGIRGQPYCSLGETHCTSLDVTGSKNVVMETSQGWKRLSVIESPEVLFLDRAVGHIENEKIIAKLDPLFAEVIEGEECWVVPAYHARRDGVEVQADTSERLLLVLAFRRGFGGVRFPDAKRPMNRAEERAIAFSPPD